MSIDRRAPWLTLLAALIAGCTAEGVGNAPAGSSGAGADAGPDASVLPDAGPDAGRDAGGDAGRDAGGDAGRDAGRDGGRDAALDANSDPCGTYRREVYAFVTSHRECSIDSDCAIAGGCSGGFGFEAVSVDAEEQAQTLSDAHPEGCEVWDGPLFGAVCDDGECHAAPTGAWCGLGDGPNLACADGLYAYTPSCDSARADAVDIEPGCHQRCEDSEDCPASLECLWASICEEGTSEGCVDCEPRSAQLCLPSEACELVLGLDFDGKPGASLPDDEAIVLNAWAKNVSSAAITFSVDPCVSVEIEGIEGYDFFDSCAAGQCIATEPREITVQPGETVILATSSLQSAASTCNANGIERGTYSLTFSVLALSGAQACGPLPAQLRAF